LEKNDPPAPGAAPQAEAPAHSGPADNPPSESLPAPPEVMVSPPPPAQPASDLTLPRRITHLADFLAGMDHTGSKKTALSSALALWGTSLPIREYADKDLIDPETYFNLTARRNGFQIYRMQSSRTGISKLNLPAIFEFSLPDVSEPFFLTLSRISEETFTFLTNTPNGQIDVTADEVDRLWTGLAYVPWTNFFEYEGVTPISGGEQGVMSLKQLLEKIGHQDLPPGPVYDPETASLIREIQARYGIPVDGLVGPLTKMALYNELPGLDIPHIQTGGSSPQPSGRTSQTGQPN
jgi:general secretion pathway protein A